MDDVAPALIEAITRDFRSAYDDSEKIRVLLAKVDQGTATYEEAQAYALEVSRLIGQAYQNHVSSAALPDGRMYYNIASRLIPSTMDENYELVANYAMGVQQGLNQRAKIGLKVQPPEKNQDRIDGLVELVSNADRYDDVSEQLLSAMENFSQNVADETIRANADSQYRAGMQPKIIRKAERKCCAWCSALAGEYDYPDVPHDVYRRHENCRCTVEYDPADGKRKCQNVHTKKWTSAEDRAKIETRKKAGLMSPSRRRYKPDVVIGKSVGAKAKNYDVLDPESGEYFNFVQDTRIQNVEAFAGKGVKRPLRPEVAEGLSEQIGGSPDNWQHCKGNGVIDYHGEERWAEVHWFQEESVGKVKFKVKRWIDEG